MVEHSAVNRAGACSSHAVGAISCAAVAYSYKHLIEQLTRLRRVFLKGLPNEQYGEVEERSTLLLS